MSDMGSKNIITLIAVFVLIACPMRITGSSAQEAQETQEVVCLKTRPEFAAIQKIIGITQKIAAQTQMPFDYSEPNCDNIKHPLSGLMLALCRTHPVYLKTPWGEIRLSHDKDIPHEQVKEIWDIFTANMDLQFLHNDAENTFNTALENIPYGHFFANDQTIRASHLNRYRGTNMRITSAAGFWSWYAVAAVCGQSLPKLELASANNKNHQECKQEYGALMKEYLHSGTIATIE